MKYRRFVLLFLMSGVGLWGKADIAVVTMAVGEEYRETVGAGLENKREYCAKHGYDFICIEEWLDDTRPLSWNQINALSKVLKESDYKWVFWSDADSLVMNQAIGIEELIYPEFDLIMSLDQHSACYHTGEFLLKNSAWSRAFLERVYAKEQFADQWRGELMSIVELWQQDSDVRLHTQLLPQRMCNAFLTSISEDMRIGYRPGDFILHFTDSSNRCTLKEQMDSYAKKVIDQKVSIDHHLGFWGFVLEPKNSYHNEGYMSLSQRAQFISRLQATPAIKTVLEIGLNGGHSAEMFFEQLPHLQSFLSFDICFFEYTRCAVNYFQQKYRSRFTFIEGNSMESVPQFAEKHPGQTFDLIYIDGSHRYEIALADIQNCQKFAHKNTRLWIDDYNTFPVQMVINELHAKRIIQVDCIHFSYEREAGQRWWVEAHYLEPPEKPVNFDLSCYPLHHFIYKILK